MSRFNNICKGHRAFRRLTSVTLQVHINNIQTWMNDIIEMLSAAPLERFHVYATTTSSLTMDEFWKYIVTMHGSRLKRFSVHRMKISLDALHDICFRCSVLEELFIFIDRRDLVCDLYLFCFGAHLPIRMAWQNASLPLATSAQFM